MFHSVSKALLTAVLSAVMAIGAYAADADFNLATYNIRQKNHPDSVQGDGWGLRYPVVAQLIRFHGFDIFGTQEGFKSQLEDLKANLPDYDYIGVGRDDGKEGGEYVAIFYRTDLFEVVDHGDFWLSEHPDRPGLGWDAACNRICTWGKFRHKPSGREFLYFNLHLDHIGKKARVESTKLVQAKMKEFGSELPTFLSGDFNVDQTNESYKALANSGVLADSYELADIVYANNGTFNNYDPNGYDDSRIDHIFVSPQVTVKRYGILTDTYRTTAETPSAAGSASSTSTPAPGETRRYRARTPSDHFPVMIQVTF